MTQQQTELILDRTLRALGNAEPAPGFTTRLHAHLAQPAAATSARPRRLFFAPSRPLFALCIAALLCTLTALHQRHAHQGSSKLPSATVATEQVPSAPPNPTLKTEPHASNLPLPAWKAQQGPRPPRVHTADPVQLPARAPDASDDLDAQALNDLHTPSFPSPALPLTSQERLVRLMLRRGEKHDLAQLDPARTNAFFDTEKASFSTFFDPAPPPQPEGDPQ